jgi:hypothetical protein
MEPDMDFEHQVTTALRTAAESVVPPVESLVRAGEQRGVALRRRRSRSIVAAGAGVSLVAAAAIAVLPRAGLFPSPSSSSPAASASAAGECRTVVEKGVLPSWAWTGFSDPQAGGVPFVRGEEGNIVAILFGERLFAPEAKGRSNKVLWVSRQEQQPLQALVIEAQRAGTSQSVRREVPGGPGPSNLDLPSPGCWHLSLSWDAGRQHDSLDLVYAAPA